jgi:hypothetical protein
MQRIGVPVTVIERLLNHKSGTFKGIVGVCQRHEYDAEKRDALERWADHIDGLVKDKPAAKLIGPKFGRRRS